RRARPGGDGAVERAEAGAWRCDRLADKPPRELAGNPPPAYMAIAAPTRSAGPPSRRSRRPLPDHDPQRGDLGPQGGSVNAQRLRRPDLVPLGVAEDPGEQVPLRQGEPLGVEILRARPQS